MTEGMEAPPQPLQEQGGEGPFPPACPAVQGQAEPPGLPELSSQPLALGSAPDQQPTPCLSQCSSEGHSGGQQPGASLQEAQPLLSPLQPAVTPPPCDQQQEQQQQEQQQEQEQLSPPPPPQSPMQLPQPAQPTPLQQHGRERHSRKQAHPSRWQPCEQRPRPAGRLRTPPAATGRGSTGAARGAAPAAAVLEQLRQAAAPPASGEPHPRRDMAAGLGRCQAGPSRSGTALQTSAAEVAKHLPGEVAAVTQEEEVGEQRADEAQQRRRGPQEQEQQQGHQPPEAGGPPGRPEKGEAGGLEPAEKPVCTPSGGSASVQSGPAQGQQQPQHGQQPVNAGQEEEQEEPLVCTHCGADHTSGHWGRHPATGERLCSACRQYIGKHGKERPVGVRCLQCSSSSPGPYRAAAWQLHPTTGERWLCSPCFYAARHEAAKSGGKKEEGRPEGRQEQQRSDSQPGRQCLECGGTQPGRSRTASWHQHPAAALEWLCERCFGQAQKQHKQVAAQPTTCWQAGKRQRSPEPQPSTAAAGGSTQPAAKRQRQNGRKRQQQGMLRVGEGEEAEEEQQQMVCSHCGAESSCQWRRHPMTGARLCNTCRQYMHDGQERPVAVRCLQCGSNSPGATHGKHAGWHAHPATGQRWLCSPCYGAALRQAGKPSGQPPAEQRQCLECGATSPGRSRAAHWCQHPNAHTQWLCQSCYDGWYGGGQAQKGSKQQAAGASRKRQPAERQPREQEQQQQQQQRQQQPTKRQRISKLQQTPSNGSSDSGAAPRRLRQKRQRSQPDHPATPPLGTAAAAAGAGPGSPPSQQAPEQAQQQAQQVQQQVQQQAQQDLFGLLMAAASSPEAAGSGLTPDLAASFSALMDTLPTDQQAAKEGRLRMLLADGLHSAAARLMETALRLALPRGT